MKPCVTVLITSLVACQFAVAVCAQNFPYKPLRMIVPSSPGGGSDIMGRFLAQKLAEQLGQPVVVENRPGASSMLGTDAAAKSAPDGYTLVIPPAAVSVNPSIFARMPYDTLRDLAAISQVAESANVLVAHPALPVRTIRDLIALARAKPGVINYTSAGSGSPGHLAAEYLKKLAAIDMVHIPQKGAAPALLDVVAGHADLYFTAPISAQPLVKSGRVRQIAVTSAKRFPPLVDVPTVAEAGFPAFDIAGWWGLLAPAALPREILARMHAETLKAVEHRDTRDKLTAQSIMVVTNTPEQFAAHIRSEIANWSRIVAASGARIE